MKNEVTETQQVESETKTLKIKASCELWEKFRGWMRVQGCQTFPEAFRASMRQVTNFNGQSQQQIS